MSESAIEGVHVFAPQVHTDNRGQFLEWFHGGRLLENIGHPLHLAQANLVVSRRGVIRGLHFADVPPGQAKYVTCVSGRVYDVAVDLRVGSPTFGRWQSVLLEDTSRRGVYLAEGIGHALLSLSEESTVVYLCSERYNPERERTVDPLDPQIGVQWPDVGRFVLSDRDSQAPSLAEARDRELLPDYRACQANDALLRQSVPFARLGGTT